MKREKIYIAIIIAGTVMATEKISNAADWAGSPILTILLKFLIPLVLILIGTVLCANDFKSKQMRFGNNNNVSLWVYYIAAFTGILTVVYSWTPKLESILSGNMKIEAFIAAFSEPYYKPYRLIMYTTVLLASIAIINYFWQKSKDRITLVNSMVISSAVFFMYIFVRELYSFFLLKSFVIYSVIAATPFIISILLHSRITKSDKLEDHIPTLFLLDISVMALGLKLVIDYLRIFCLLAISDPNISFASCINVKSLSQAALGIGLFLYGLNCNEKKSIKTDS